MKTRRMKVVYVEQGKAPQLRTVGSTLTDLKGELTEEVEIFYPPSGDIAIIYDNSKNFGTDELVMTDRFIVCGLSRKGFCSLTQTQQETYLRKFSLSENKFNADEQKR